VSMTVTYRANVLVIGGGPTGTWAALTAAFKGAKVIHVDKGYCGSSGATASAGTSLLFVPGTQQQAQAICGKEALGSPFWQGVACVI
jgi:succinate dehydrogenase/fumarate reductase flavoprotein subunit